MRQVKPERASRIRDRVFRILIDLTHPTRRPAPKYNNLGCLKCRAEEPILKVEISALLAGKEKGQTMRATNQEEISGSRAVWAFVSREKRLNFDKVSRRRNTVKQDLDF